jgi:hypothetical protein
MWKNGEYRRTPVAQPSTSLASYLAESVPISRWYLYTLRFLLFFMFLGMGTSAISMLPARVFVTRVIVIPLVLSLAMCAVLYLTERYGRRYEGPRYEWAFIALWAALLAIAIAIAWHGIERHRHAMTIDSTSMTTYR